MKRSVSLRTYDVMKYGSRNVYSHFVCSGGSADTWLRVHTLKYVLHVCQTVKNVKQRWAKNV